MAQHPFVGLLAASVVSLLAHGFAYASLSLAPKPPHEPAPSRVSFRVRASAPPPAPPPPKAPEPPAAEQRAKPPKSKPLEPVNPAPAATPSPAVDLRGVTLTNDSGGGAWTSAVGDGSALQGPVGPIGARTPLQPSAAAPMPSAPSRVEEPGLVSLGDLSSKPVPPELAGNLADRYPAAAKERRIGGSASVEARIEPDGRVRRVVLKSESFAGFGDACRQTLLGSRWSPPRDREGQRVATVVRYTCRFVVQP
jgi:TonB family protein